MCKKDKAFCKHGYHVAILCMQCETERQKEPYKRLTLQNKSVTRMTFTNIGYECKDKKKNGT